MLGSSNQRTLHDATPLLSATRRRANAARHCSTEAPCRSRPQVSGRRPPEKRFTDLAGGLLSECWRYGVVV
eukprot:11193044-Lingulodinium_polyedra.AAC.1